MDTEARNAIDNLGEVAKIDVKKCLEVLAAIGNLLDENNVQPLEQTLILGMMGESKVLQTIGEAELYKKMKG